MKIQNKISTNKEMIEEKFQLIVDKQNIINTSMRLVPCSVKFLHRWRFRIFLKFCKILTRIKISFEKYFRLENCIATFSAR